MTVDLTGLVADPVGDNPERVRDLANLARRLGDGVPFVLLPVRIETRFVKVELPIATATPLATLTARIAESATALERIAARNLATVLPAGNKASKLFKERVEQPLYADVRTALAAAETALDAGDVLLRESLDGDARAVAAAQAAATRVRAALAGAARSLQALRSEFMRDELGRELTRLAKRAAGTLDRVEQRQLPATRLRDALRGPKELPGRGRRDGAATLAHGELARGAQTFERVLAGLRAAPDDATLEQLAADASTIPLLPAAWKAELLKAVEATGRVGTSDRLDELATVIERIRSDERPDVEVELTKASRTVDRLLVRFYPDDLAVDTHEEALTAEEVEAGRAFWQQAAAAGRTEAAARAAWRALCTGRGARRGAWIARVTEPDEWTATPGSRAGERLLAGLTTFERRLDEVERLASVGARFEPLVRAAEAMVDPAETVRPLPAWAIEEARKRYQVVRGTCLRWEAQSRRPPVVTDPVQKESRADLVRALRKLDLRLGRLKVEAPRDFEDPEVGPLKESAWTRAAGSGVLPRRFLVVAVRGTGAAHVVAGARVPADLRLGLDPDPANPDSERFQIGTDGELEIGESIRWMVDYEEAVAKGMAVAVDITAAEAQIGFDRIYVLGLQSGRARDGASDLEDLLDNHHYGTTGLALLPVGTPTNNSEQGGAGYRSAEDAEAAFAIEQGAPPFGASDPVHAGSPDGLRLAHAFGIRTSVLAHVAGAGGRDAAETLAVNRALYPATIGAWLEEHAGPLIGIGARDRLRAFALAHVAGRGLLPAFRVGPQPYGVLATTAHSKFAADPAEALPGAAPTELARQATFDRLLVKVLNVLADEWRAAREEHVEYATDEDIDDARAAFLRILGLEPVSSAGAYRFGVNVAGRRSPAAHDPALEFGIPAGTGTTGTGADFGPFAFMRRFESVLRDAFAVPAGAQLLTDGQVSPEFQAIYDLISSSRAYELRQLDRAHSLRGPAVGSHATYLPALAQTSPVTLAQQTVGGRNRPLLELLARHSLLLEWREAALRSLVAEGMMTEAGRVAAGASTHYVVSSYTNAYSLTRWSYLLASLGELNHLQGIDFAGAPLFGALGSGGVLGDVLPRYRTQFPGGPHTARVRAAEQHAAHVAGLATIPAERLEPLLYEHLDLAGHRLDAWITGLAQRRLMAMRVTHPDGVHLGAYGWVDDLRPDLGDDDPAPHVPPALDGDPSRPIHIDSSSQGFVQTPSVNHAVTAAILRSGYLSQRSEEDIENRMAVNLSSRRTRLALGLIDGVRAGNRLGALLGYRLERFLHEYHATSGITLDAVIGPLRRAYPSVAGVDRALSAEARSRQVCDGLAIAEAVKRWLAMPAGVAAVNAAGRNRTLYEVLSSAPAARPWGLVASAIPASGDPKLDGVLRAIDHIADALDALGDVAIAEAVHQITLGNHERAAAVLTALAEGKALPRPEVVDTPRTGTPVTHRVLLPLPAGAGWARIPATPRSLAEPRLNAWAAALLGDPEQLRVRVVRAQDGSDAGDVSVAALGLQAIDLVAILGPGLEAGIGELGARALDALRPASLDDGDPPPLLQAHAGRAPLWPEHVRGLADMAPLVEAIGALVGRARPATARDFLTAEQGVPAGPDGLDAADLGERVQAARAELEAAALALARLVGGDTAALADVRALLDAASEPVWAQREQWRAALLRVAAFGLPAALPPAIYAGQAEVLRGLRDAAETALLAAAERLQNADAALARGAGEEAARALFGEGFKLVPLATLRNVADLDSALGAGLASPAELDGWLQGAGAVREGARGLADVLVLADAGGADVDLGGGVAQLPFLAGEPWLGGSLPAADDHAGRLSLAIMAPEALPADGVAGAALLVDEWTEIVPSTHETTGVAVHYDQPDATAPQCVLVAVPPVKRGQWRLGELVQILHDTFELAQLRTVELEHLQSTLLGQLLPLISGEIVPNALGGPPPAGERVILDFGANN